MCGRYSLNAPPEPLAAHFQADVPFEWQPRLNAAPSQHLPVLLGHDRFVLMTWGYMPSWAKTRLINARAETLSEKPTFRAAFRARRCLVPADAFYEWHTLPNGKKQPMRFALRNGDLFAFGGVWLQEDDSSPSFLVITTAPNDLVAPIHNRMPFIVPPERYAAWLDADTSLDTLRAMLSAYPAEQMICEPISSNVLRHFT
ncbi:MAG: SOS response-associated peptidase [Anaerolineae bacterium]|nr:SOS response-associated peptidase [Anaerolineae bacterium]